MPSSHKNDVQSLMVTDGLSKLGYTSVIFLDSGVKVYVANVTLLLSQQLLSAICKVSGEFIFQHYSAPAYTAG